MKTNKFTDFTGERIVGGIDVHKKQWSVTIIFNGMEYKTFSSPAEPEAVAQFLNRHFPGGSYEVAYESGFSGFWIQRKFSSLGINCIITNPCDIPSSDKDRKRKTDIVDSRKIARALWSNQLVGIYVPDFEHEQERNLVRSRYYLVKDTTRVKNRIKHTLLRYNIRCTEVSENWTKGYIKWLKSIELTTVAGTFHLQNHISQLEELLNRQKLVNRQIIELSNSPKYQESVRRLRQIGGVGLKTSMTVLTELHDISRFNNLDALCGYIGFIPNIYASGDTERVGRMTKRGNKYLRHVLIEASWRTIREEPGLAMAYKKYTTRMKGNKAVIRIARKLLSRIRFVLRNEAEYQSLVA